MGTDLSDVTAQSEQIDAPWTDDQVAALNDFQSSNVVHPFTSGGGKTLIATRDGWVEEEGGPVVQTWAYSLMADSGFLRQHIQLASGLLPDAPDEA